MDAKREDRYNVVILTATCRIEGDIALYQGARLTDYLIEGKSFMAVTAASITDRKTGEIEKLPFINVRRDAIEVVFPQ